MYKWLKKKLSFTRMPFTVFFFLVVKFLGHCHRGNIETERNENSNAIHGHGKYLNVMVKFTKKNYYHETIVGNRRQISGSETRFFVFVDTAYQRRDIRKGAPSTRRPSRWRWRDGK